MPCLSWCRSSTLLMSSHEPSDTLRRMACALLTPLPRGATEIGPAWTGAQPEEEGQQQRAVSRVGAAEGGGWGPSTSQGCLPSPPCIPTFIAAVLRGGGPSSSPLDHPGHGHGDDASSSNTPHGPPSPHSEGSPAWGRGVGETGGADHCLVTCGGPQAVRNLLTGRWRRLHHQPTQQLSLHPDRSKAQTGSGACISQALQPVLCSVVMKADHQRKSRSPKERALPRCCHPAVD